MKHPLKNFPPANLDEDQYPILTPCENLYVGSEVNISGFKSYELPDAEVLERITLKNELNISKQRICKSIPVPDISQKIVLNEYNGNVKVYMERMGAEKYGGFSGGPVYENLNLYGIVISHLFLKSDYIKHRLHDLNIQILGH